MVPLDGPTSACRAAARVSQHHKPRLSWLTTLVVALSLGSAASASLIDPAPLPTPPADLGEALLLDTRVPVFWNGAWTMMPQEEHDLRKRAEASSSHSDGSVTATVEITVSRVTATSSTRATTQSSASPLPSPFDGGLASNFTATSCPAFINWFLSDRTFKQCYPFSVLLQSSMSLFEAEKSLVSITQVLDASCAANATFCSGFLTELAQNLTDASNCGTDYERGNSVVVQAYVGLMSYQTLYGATCLKDPGTSLYCFANAITNLTTPSNVYVYFLPLDVPLPGGSVPACSQCLEQTMAIYQVATADTKQSIYKTYGSAAQQINTICGPNFVNGTIAAAAVANAAFSPFSRGLPSSWLLLSTLAVAAANWLL